MAEAISTTNGHLELQFPIIAGSLRYFAGKYCEFFPLSFMFSNKMSKVVAQSSCTSFSRTAFCNDWTLSLQHAITITRHILWRNSRKLLRHKFANQYLFSCEWMKSRSIEMSKLTVGAMKMAKSCMEGSASNLRGSEAQNLSPAKTFHWRISVKIYPSSWDLYTQYLFMSDMCIGWLYICFVCDRCNMSSIKGDGNWKPLQKRFVLTLLLYH